MRDTDEDLILSESKHVWGETACLKSLHERFGERPGTRAVFLTSHEEEPRRIVSTIPPVLNRGEELVAQKSDRRFNTLWRLTPTATQSSFCVEPGASSTARKTSLAP